MRRGLPDRAGGIAACLAALLALGACGGETRPPNVVLISIDTLRADALGAYGGPLPTPSFDAVARDGTLFERAIAPTSETAPSHATLLTGQEVLEHGVLKNGVPLREELETLAQVFQRAGFATAGFASSFVLDPRFGWGRGFEHFDARFPAAGETLHVRQLEHGDDFWQGMEFDGFDRRGHETTRAARAWLAEAREPFFLFVHYFDAHEPHEPPAPYLRRTASLPVDLAHRWYPGAPDSYVEGWVRAYQADVLYQDDALGGLLDALAAPGLRERTLLVITSDHGQGLGQHGWLGHQVGLHDELVHVPLVLRWPGRVAQGRRIATPVALGDLAPTLAELAGVPAPQGAQGRSLAGALLDGAALEARPVFGYRRLYEKEHFGHRGEKFSLRTPEWKYIRGSVDPDELFDLRADPQELRDLHGERADVIARLAPLLDAWLAKAPPRLPAPALSEETRRGLEALGYTE